MDNSVDNFIALVETLGEKWKILENSDSFQIDKNREKTGKKGKNILSIFPLSSSLFRFSFQSNLLCVRKLVTCG